MTASDDTWKKLVHIYNHAKKLLLLAEEVDPASRTFLPPILELRSCLDHIFRARGVELGLVEDKGQEYIQHSYGKALGHAYRAFFDAADVSGILIRRRIRTARLSHRQLKVKKVAAPILPIDYDWVGNPSFKERSHHEQRLPHRYEE